MLYASEVAFLMVEQPVADKVIKSSPQTIAVSLFLRIGLPLRFKNLNTA